MIQKKSLLSLTLAFITACSLLPAILSPAEALGTESSSQTQQNIYAADYLVTLPNDGVVAEVRYWDKSGERVVTTKYSLTDNKNNPVAQATRKDVNEALTDAWRNALDLSRNSSKWIPEDKATIFTSCGDRVELHLYTDWIAINGKFNPDGSDNGFDGGELEIDGWDDAKLMLDLHGHTMDRGSTSSKKYGRLIDIYNNGSTFALVSSGDMGTMTGGWDDEGGAFRSDDDCTLFFDNIHFTGNHAEKGGAVYTLDEGITYIENCIFSKNVAEERGGALATAKVLGGKASTDYLYFTNTELRGNTCYGDGGAVYASDIRFRFQFIDCRIFNNHANGDGGAVFVATEVDLDLVGATSIHNNHANGDGGGIFLEAFYDYQADLNLYGGNVYGNTAGSSNPSASDIHLDTGIRESGEVYVGEGYSPAFPIGLVAEENGQIVLRNKDNDNSGFAAMVSKSFYAARSDQYLKTVGGWVYAEKFSETKIGEITAFDCSINTNPLNGVEPSHVEIDNEARTINLVFPAISSSQMTGTTGSSQITSVAIELSAQCTTTKNSLADFDSNGYEANGEGSLRLFNDTGSSGFYRGSFLLWNSDLTASTPWVVTASFTNDYEATLAMKVVCGSNTTSYYATNANAFEEGWNEAARQLKSGNNVTVTLYRDWFANSNGSFGEGTGFNDGRISLNAEKNGILTLDLNGHTIDRGLKSKQDSGQVFRLSEKSKLKIIDSSAQGGGIITGGYNNGSGGGFYMVDSASLTLDNVTVSGNRATRGGGIYLDDSACLTIQNGAVISENSCVNNDSYNDGGGGISAKGDSTVWLYDGKIINNTSTPKGGGIYWCSEGKLYLLGGEITGNYSSNGDTYDDGGGVMVENYFETFVYYIGTDPYFGGTIRITDNHSGGEAGKADKVSNVTLKSEDENLNHYTALPLAPSASIGINISYYLGTDGKDCISASGSNFYADSSQYFFADEPNYAIVADSAGSGSNVNRLHIVSSRNKDFAKADCAITGISFGIEGESAAYDEDKRSVIVTANADRYFKYTNISPTTLTVTSGGSISSDTATHRDYTQPQTFVLTAPDGATKHTWTVQVVPAGGTWNEYEVKAYGGSADKYFYHPGETVTITAEERTDTVFSHWNIAGMLNGFQTAKTPQHSFIMPASDVIAEAVHLEILDSVEVTMSELKPGEPFSSVTFTADHNVGDGSFKGFAPIWYDASGTMLSSSTEIEANTTYRLTFTLEPSMECALSDSLSLKINGENATYSIAGDAIYVNTLVVTGEADYATVTVKDEADNVIPAYRYSLTKDGELLTGEQATFLPDEQYYDVDTNKFYQLASVSGITDSDPLTAGWQFTVTDPTNIVVTYTSLTAIGEIALSVPAITPGSALPTTLGNLPTNVVLESLTWDPADNRADYCTDYLATMVLKPKKDYIFDSLVEVKLDKDLDGDNANDAYLCTTWTDRTLTVSFVVSTGKDQITKVTLPGDISILQGTELSLPDTLAVTAKGGSVHSVEVAWQEPSGFSVNIPGEYTFTGTLDLPYHVELGAGVTNVNAQGKFSLKVTVAPLGKLALPDINLEQKDVNGTRCIVAYLSHDANVYYAISAKDGNAPDDPTAASTPYTGGIVLTEAGTYIIKAIAISENATSDVLTHTITVPQTYTLTHKAWIDDAFDETKTTSVTAVAGESFTITAEALAGKAFLGHRIFANGSTTDNTASSFAYTMPAENVTIDSVYITRTSSVGISNVSTPVAYLAFDDLASVSVTLPYDADDDKQNDVISHDNIVVTWKDAQGSAVTKAEHGETYTGTITLKDSAANGVVFADNVAVTGLNGATATRDGDKLVITFTMTAGKISVSDNLNLAPTEALIVEKNTSANPPLPSLPETLNVPTAVGGIPVNVTWTCVHYDPAVEGTYTFSATFDLDEAGVANPNDYDLSATISVRVVDSSVALPTANPGSGVYMEDQEVALSAENNAEIWYTLNGGPSTKYSGTIELNGEAGKTKTFTIKARAVKGDSSSAVATFQYTIKLPVTVTVNGGTLANGATSGAFQPGEQVTVVASNLTAYNVFAGWTASGITIDNADKTKSSYTFTVPTSNVSLTASYEAKQVNHIDLNVSAPTVNQPLAASGTYSLSFAQAGVSPILNTAFTPTWDSGENAQFGSVYTVTFTLPQGYDLASSATATVNGNTATWNSATRTISYTFPAVTDAYASHVNPAAISNVSAGTTIASLLPATVEVTTKGGSTANVQVNWACESGATLTSGSTVTVSGTLNTADLAAKHVTGGANAKVSVLISSAALPQVATPTAVPASGTYRGSVEASLHCTTGGASIYYTTDSSDPTTASNLYAGPFTLTATTTIKAIAVKNGMDDSAVATSTYTITPLYTLTVIDGTGGGQYAEGDTVTIRANTLENKRFTGWTKDNDNSTIVSTAPAYIVTMGAADATYTAKYEDVSQTAEVSVVDITVPTIKVGDSSLPTKDSMSITQGVTIESVTWNHTGTVERNTLYTAMITIEATGKNFSEHGTVRVNGDEVRSVMNDDGTVTLTYQVMFGALEYASHSFDATPITGVAWNTALEDMGLPTTATITTTNGSEYVAAVSWDFERCTYVQGDVNAQTFEVNGIIVLPTGVEGTDPEVKVTVSVLAMPYIPPADPEDSEPSYVTCDGGEDCPLSSFTDLNANAWYHDGVHFCVEQGLMQGIGNDKFAPNATATRAMFVTILWRLEGCPTSNYEMDFEDVDAGRWYTEAIRWAAEHGIAGGYGGDTFGTNDPVTREQAATIMWRYAKHKGQDVSVGENTNILSYGDGHDVAGWAAPAMQWACGSGVIRGIADGDAMNLAPQDSATRAQTATIVQRHCTQDLK